ncbi:MAG: histidine phosphatase family protein [Saprospiraceae bacterium]|nr:histidine phosphatase family protein [Candidatus Vicinibacter affinis]
MYPKEVYFIRHGETEQNKLGIVQGSGIDSELNTLGLIQGESFYKISGDKIFDLVIASDMQKHTRPSNFLNISKELLKEIHE